MSFTCRTEKIHMALRAELHITEAGQPDRIAPVREVMSIGRAGDNDTVLRSNSVSRYHAMLVRAAAGVWLVDLDSSTGTLVNGVPALPDEPVRLCDGDELRFGQVVARYIAPEAAPAGPGTSPGARNPPTMEARPSQPSRRLQPALPALAQERSW
jgi:predicted component of type VI protein secretion system